jgi:hypothetical protein
MANACFVPLSRDLFFARIGTCDSVCWRLKLLWIICPGSVIYEKGEAGNFRFHGRDRCVIKGLIVPYRVWLVPVSPEVVEPAAAVAAPEPHPV